MTEPSREFLMLAATLIDALPSSHQVSDTALLQLHSVFGPMLLSALQLIDRREVVRITLPQGRHIYQVTSSTGLPYTLHVDFPDLAPHPSSEKSPNPSPPPPLDPDEQPDSPLTTTTSLPPLALPTRTEPPSQSQDPPPLKSSLEGQREDQIAEKRDAARRRRIMARARILRSMYCPCPGFMYNSLAGEKNVLCKHLLAVMLSQKLEKTVNTEVAMLGVASLLGDEPFH